jgi:hypothetical protein
VKSELSSTPEASKAITRKWIMRLLTLLCLILLATIPVLACAWDSDTLAMEAKG